MTEHTASSLAAGDNAASPVRVGEVVADKYVIERMLGLGGMGVVMAARDKLLDRRVAIKFLLPKLAGSETAVHRFMREARAATRVTSEHVVRLLEIEKLPSGTPFFVMEYLEGSDLRALLRERGALSPSLAVDYVLQALQAVAEGHVKGVVHRDIKPGNLFLTSRADGTPLIKVLDFGIAKTIESDAVESTSLTSSDDVRLGSPAYMPPEQLQNPRDVDTRSDIWSIGATLYELLCGRPPFEASGYLELASRILSQPPVPFSEQKPPSTVPAGLEKVLRKCLEKERSLRYANAAELAAALAPYGSEDARMSLHRVSGLLQSNPSLPALTRSIPHDATEPQACTATLEVPVSPPVNQDERRTSAIGAIASQPAPRSSRSWLVVGAAAALIGVVVLVRHQTTPQAGTELLVSPAVPAADTRVAPPTEPQSPALAPSGVPALAEAPAAPAQASATPAPSALEHARGLAPSAAKPPKPVARRLDLAAGSALVAASATQREAEPSGRGATEPASEVQSVSSSVAAGGASGRSAEIERLIEERR